MSWSSASARDGVGPKTLPTLATALVSRPSHTLGTAARAMQAARLRLRRPPGRWLVWGRARCSPALPLTRRSSAALVRLTMGKAWGGYLCPRQAPMPCKRQSCSESPPALTEATRPTPNPQCLPFDALLPSRRVCWPGEVPGGQGDSDRRHRPAGGQLGH